MTNTETHSELTAYFTSKSEKKNEFNKSFLLPCDSQVYTEYFSPPLLKLLASVCYTAYQHGSTVLRIHTKH